MTTRAQPLNTPVTLVPEAELGGSHSAGWWAMLILILNEAVLFAALIASYFYIRINSPAWPQANIPRPALVLPLIMTVVLVSSSFFMQWAENSIKHGNVSRMRLALLIAFLLAAVFLGLLFYRVFGSRVHPADRHLRLAVHCHHRLAREPRAGGRADEPFSAGAGRVGPFYRAPAPGRGKHRPVLALCRPGLAGGAFLPVPVALLIGGCEWSEPKRDKRKNPAARASPSLPVRRPGRCS